MTIDLNGIHSPSDIKGMDIDTLRLLSEELRAVLIKKLASHGGHVGPNLGVVEATVALHYVFDAPKDQIVFDVSHQSYVHKMLTGRIGAFTDPAHYDDVTGYTCPRESPEYDLFEVGHTSTSISLATGLAKARDLRGGDGNVVAFIGDASLGGGMALEALDYAPELGSNIIIIVNDNQMSIAENHGELYSHLAHLRATAGKSDNNIFKALGYEYIYVAEGNDLRALIRAYRQAKDSPRAVLIHINTMKGSGLPVAEKEKEQFHYHSPFDPATGAPLSADRDDSYQDIFAKLMLELMHEDGSVALLNAGTPGAIGMTAPRREAAGRQMVDVGIAEQDCVTMAAGMARGGARAVMGVVATFLQRAYDQLSHDVAINNLPVTIVDFYGGIFAMNDMTHLGFFDVAMVSNIPGILFLSPATVEEYESMIRWSVAEKPCPVVIRTPGGAPVHADRAVLTPFTRYDVIRRGADVAIIGEGALLQNALKAADILRESGVEATVINPRVLSQVDTECLDSLRGYRHVITVEDGIVDGGFGQKVAAYLGGASCKVTCLELKKEFLDRYSVKDVLEANSLTPEAIATIALA